MKDAENTGNLCFAALRAWLFGRHADVIALLSQPSWNWDRFVEEAYSSGVLSALRTESLPAAIKNKLPQEVLNLLAVVQETNGQRNQLAIAQATELASALNAAGIEPLALKGLANLLSGIYPNAGMRYMADIDLLVQPDQIAAAVTAMEALGYSSQEAHPVEFSIGHTYPPLQKADSLEVDLHRAAGLGISASFLPVSQIMAASTTHNLNGAVVRLPSPNHLIVHHIMHSQLHDVYRERICPSLRTLNDFALLCQHFCHVLDWPAIAETFRTKGQYASFELYLLQAEHYLGVHPPINLRPSLLTRIRHARRLLLRSHPRLRFFDPCYYFLAGIKPRTRRLREILSHSQGWHYLLQKFTSRKFYTRLLSDFRG